MGERGGLSFLQIASYFLDAKRRPNVAAERAKSTTQY